jgi:hypothetical protein
VWKTYTTFATEGRTSAVFFHGCIAFTTWAFLENVMLIGGKAVILEA